MAEEFLTLTGNDMSNQDWLETRKYKPEKIALARQVLEEVRSGKLVAAAVSEHPLPGGEGYLGKNVLVELLFVQSPQHNLNLQQIPLFLLKFQQKIHSFMN